MKRRKDGRERQDGRTRGKRGGFPLIPRAAQAQRGRTRSERAIARSLAPRARLHRSLACARPQLAALGGSTHETNAIQARAHTHTRAGVCVCVGARAAPRRPASRRGGPLDARSAPHESHPAPPRPKPTQPLVHALPARPLTCPRKRLQARSRGQVTGLGHGARSRG